MQVAAVLTPAALARSQICVSNLREDAATACLAGQWHRVHRTRHQIPIMASQENFPEFDVHKTKAGGYTNLRESRDRFEISVDGLNTEAFEGEPLIEAINRCGRELAQVCYHPQLGPIETCDTCMVEINGDSGARLRHQGRARYAGSDQLRRRKAAQTRGLRPHSRQPSSVLHGLRQQQRQLHGAQHHRVAEGRAPDRFPSSPRAYAVDESIRFTATIPTSASCVDGAWKRARTCR